MIVPDAKRLLTAYLKSKGATSLELISRTEIKEAMRCGNGSVDRYLKGVEPIRGKNPKYYATDDVARVIVEVER